jgi:hypothetical protein
MGSNAITQHGSPTVRDPLISRNYFDIDWIETGWRERHAPTDPQLVVTLHPGRWINDSGAVITVQRVTLVLANGTNCLQLDRVSGAIVTDAQFNADSLPLWQLETDLPRQRITGAMDVRGIAGLPVEV